MSNTIDTRRGFFPWIQQINRQGTGILRALYNERLSPEQVRDLQNRKLRNMVQHVYTNSRFYQEKFRQAGLKPNDIQTVDDLPKLPPTTKDELRVAGPDEILAHGYTKENTIDEPTSGSSGIVLHIYHAPEAFDSYFAYAFRPLLEIGYRPWHRAAYTALEPVAPLPWEKFGLGVRQLIDMNKKDPRAYLETLLQIKPQLMLGFPSVFMLIARSATPDELRKIRPHAILLNSELLTKEIRDAISQAFGCECFDDYSTFEFHQVAFECSQHRYHLSADNVIVEFTKNGQPVPTGEKGEILITGLTNRAMPLLRYTIGDIGAASAEICPCGRGFPVMQLVEGRADDFIIMPSGRQFSPRSVNPAFEFLPGVKEHVLVQETLDRIMVYVNIASEHAITTPQLIVEALLKLFEEPVQIEVVQTTEFEHGRTGKLRCVISKVKQSVI
jgi:phenylacetate-CoA ligase